MSIKVEYAILLFMTTIINYFVAIKIDETEKQFKRKFMLILSLIYNLGMLFIFKYFNFVSGSLKDFLSIFSIQFNSPAVTFLLPIGISFYTFQVIGYIIEVYQKTIKPEKHFGIFSLYVTFFPLLLAGPIERAKNLLPQFYVEHKFKYEEVTKGLKLMLWGFFKKIVIADRLAITVNTVFSSPTDYTGFPLIIATLFYGFQLYCDFSGYSDIAIGSAQIMGFKIMNNFKSPYQSKSISEFWTRWHISLSSWFKDYLYKPLLGNTISLRRLYLVIFVVFFLTGVWHGANWTYIMMGILHGIYIIFSIVSSQWRANFTTLIGLTKFPKLHNILRIGITFSLVNIGWIFFRASSISDAVYIIGHLFTGLSFNIFQNNNIIYWSGVMPIEFFIGVILIIFLEIMELFQNHIKIEESLSAGHISCWLVYLFLIWSILLFGVFGHNEFIYFRF